MAGRVDRRPDISARRRPDVSAARDRAVARVATGADVSWQRPFPDVPSPPALATPHPPPPVPTPRSAPAPAATSPAARFVVTIARRPLERPRALPQRLHPLARAVTGRATPPKATTGAATRAALRAAGARAAATGDVVHVPGRSLTTPRELGAVAHELAHTAEHRSARNAVATVAPRFLVGSLGRGADAGERRARQVGDAVQAAAGRAASAPGESSAAVRPTVDVGRLPVGGGGGPAAGGLPDSTVSAVAAGVRGSSTPTAAGAGTVAGVGSEIAEAIPPAGEAVRAAANRASPAGTAVSPAVSPTGVDVGEAGAAALRPPTAGAQPSGATVAGVPADIDGLVDALEERVLAELERRGGRYAGVF